MPIIDGILIPKLFDYFRLRNNYKSQSKDSFLKALMESDSPENFEWLEDQL